MASLEFKFKPYCIKTSSLTLKLCPLIVNSYFSSFPYFLATTYQTSFCMCAESASSPHCISVNHCSVTPCLTFSTVAVSTASQASTGFFQSPAQVLSLYKDVLHALLPLQHLQLLPRAVSFVLELRISIKMEDSQPFISSPKMPLNLRSSHSAATKPLQ